MTRPPDRNDEHESRRTAADSPARARATVLPYCGDRASEHFGPDRVPHCLHVYASDRSGTKSYRFNESGFRGESLDGDARFRVFVCGASYAFGTGLDLEETWSHAIKAGLGHELGVAPNRINVLNFSQSLASANYVTRTLLAQCRANRPHLVIANFSDMKRTEFFVDGAAQGVLPRRFPLHRRWKTLRHGWRQRLARMLPDLRDRRDAELRLGMWDRYAGLYSREWGVVNTLTNMLLLQSFCQSRNIDCLISWVQHDVLGEQAIRENPAIAPLIDLLDSRCFCSFSIVDSDICTDLAADDIHPGIASNRAFAARLVQTWAASYGRAPAEDDLEDTIARAMRR